MGAGVVVDRRTEAVACEVPREVRTRVAAIVIYLWIQYVWSEYAGIRLDVTDELSPSVGKRRRHTNPCPGKLVTI